ncbi:MAG: hypothetical protein LC808_28655, partial [Actinobacteria bacterium]|nr:hypothetical protein [Actinomycetota bacterium]
MGAADGDFTKISVAVSSTTDSAVLIEGLRPVVVDRADPLPGTAMLCRTGGAFAEPRRIQVDLDTEPPTFRFVDGEEEVKPFLFSLAKGESEYFFIQASTEKCNCQWRAELLVLVDGKRQVIQIDDHGVPFTTSAITNSERIDWSQGRWQPFDR